MHMTMKYAFFISVAITILSACSDLEMYTFEIPEGYITDTDTDDNLNSNDTSEDNEDTDNDDLNTEEEEEEEETYTISDATGTDDNGYEYVDLGLSSGLKWARVNIGASSPEDYGNYYAWGEIETKSTYTSSNSMTYGVEMDDISGNPEYDAAQANWGGHWRMPTKDECQELIDECTWIYTTYNDIAGYIIIGTNDNSIFLPAAGYWSSSLTNAGNTGFYWNSTPPVSGNIYASCIFFSSSEAAVLNRNRYGGFSLRAIYDEDFEYTEDTNTTETLTTAPEQLYIVGLNDNWNFDYLLYPTTNNEWKFEGVTGVSSCPWGYYFCIEEDNWNDYFRSPTGEDDGTIALSGGNNIPFSNTGVFIWTVDCENLTYEYTEVTSISYTGFNDDWTTATTMTQDTDSPWIFTANITITTASTSGGVFLLNDGWTYYIGGSTETIEWLTYCTQDASLSAGTYTITLDFVNLTCTFELIEENNTTTTNTINGYEYIDLGLSSGLKWATVNIGATLPADYGNYYAWGETETKDSFDSDNSVAYYNTSMPENIAGNTSYDAATANWGSSWRLPSETEFQELIDECTWTWTTQTNSNNKKIKGYEVEGTNGNSIFFPVTGEYKNSTLYNETTTGYYWSCTRSSTLSKGYALYLKISSSSSSIPSGIAMYLGMPIRPVAD